MVFKSRVGPQLQGFVSQLESFARRTLNLAGRKFRARLIRERLSRKSLPRLTRGEKMAGKVLPELAPNAPLAKKTGLLIRSIWYKVIREGAKLVLDARIGKGKAYYAETYENKGRLHFRRIFREEMQRVKEELRIGMQFLAANPGRGMVPAVAAAPEPVQIDPEREAIINTWREEKEKARVERYEKRLRRGFGGSLY